MNERRWQPPPMSPEPRDAVRVDEQVVRKVLRVNPGLRNGRTTSQVKRALERGDGLATPRASRADVEEPARQLSETLEFFMAGKSRELSEALEAIAARRRLLDEEEAQAREAVRGTLVGFLAMLDAEVLAAHGAAALEAHRELLGAVGATATEMLTAAKREPR